MLEAVSMVTCSHNECSISDGEHSTDERNLYIDATLPLAEQQSEIDRQVAIFKTAMTVRFPGVPICTSWNQVQNGLLTRDQWDDSMRRVLPGAEPQCLLVWHRLQEVRDDGEPLGLFEVVCRSVQLFSEENTESFQPTPLHQAHRDFYSIFARICSSQRYGWWDPSAGHWKPCHGRLRKGKVRAHVHGNDVYGVYGGKLTRFIAIDLDLHRGDRDVFREQLQVLLQKFGQRDGWHLQVANEATNGVHFFTPSKTTSLESLRHKIRIDLQKLDSQNPILAQKAHDAGMKCIGDLEIYPDPKQIFRLPLCMGRTMLLNKPLELIENKKTKHRYVQNVEGYIAWLKQCAQAGKSHYMLIDDMLSYIDARLKIDAGVIEDVIAPHTSQPTAGHAPKTPPSSASDISTIKRKKSFGQDLVDFWSGIECTPDSLNQYILKTARSLQYEVSADEAVEILDKYCRQHPAPGFSDRLSAGQYGEVHRVIKETVRRVFANNGAQPNPLASRRKLDKVHAYYVRIGFCVSDKTTWTCLHKPMRQLGPDFVWSPAETRLIAARIVPVLKTNVETAQHATKHFLRFVEGHAGQEIARDSLPQILSNYDLRIRNSQKKSSFIHTLLSIRWLCIEKTHVFTSRDNIRKGKARVYAVGPAIRQKWEVAT